MSESSGDTPDWLRQHAETPSKIFLCVSSSSDDDDMPLIRRAGVNQGNTTAAEPSHQLQAGVPLPASAADGAPQPKAEPQQAAAGGPSAPGPSRPQDPARDQPLDAHGTDDDPIGTQPQTQPIGMSQQPSAPPPSSAKRGAAAAQRLAGAPAVAVHAAAGEAGQLPIMLPEKLNRNKVLLELPDVSAKGDSHYHGAADLSGDSGAVGRIVVLATAAGAKGGAGAGTSAAGGSSGGGGGCDLQIDLKGVVYNAWVLPLAGTAMVLNIQPTEAKVESLFNDFVRLREAADQYGADADGEGLAYLLDGDDENYQIGSGEEGDEGAGPASTKAAKASKAAAKPGGKAAGAKAAGSKGAKGGQAAKPKKKAGAGGGDNKKPAATAAKKVTAAKKAGGGAGAGKAAKASGKAALRVKGGGVSKKSGATAAAAAKKKPAAAAAAAAAAAKNKKK